MGEEITIHDVYRTHRLGKHKLENNVPKPIIVKFARIMLGVGFSKLKGNIKEKCEYYRKSHKEESN